VLFVFQLDAVNRALCDRLAAEGRMPVYAELLRRGRLHELTTPATYLAASTYHTLASGLPPGEHGLYYALQWSQDEQRVRVFMDSPKPETLWERAARAGLRSLVVDPYESWPQARDTGVVLCGWQFQNVIALERWSQPADVLPRLERALGRARPIQEVFGRPSVRYLLDMRRVVLEAPGRLADATIALLRRQRFDLVWVSCLATHLGGHQFWNLGQLQEGELDPITADVLGSTLADTYSEADRALGRILDALPGDADVLVVSPLGMDEIRSRVDLLPEMLARVLSGGAEAEAAGDLLWRLRASIPVELRAAASRVLHGPATRELMARLSTARVDWSRTPAFVLPSDQQGHIRLNVRGRERDGILDPAEARAVEDRIVEGIESFRDADGGEAVAAVARIRDVVGEDAPWLEALPDLVVRWSDRPSTGLTGVTSPRFGHVRRRGAGTGRAGGHTDEAWALHLPAGAGEGGAGEPGDLADVAATVLAALGAETEGLPGPLGERACV
jgi:predicted AlkP superfamily phosphohydrolase/phosphomutase